MTTQLQLTFPFVKPDTDSYDAAGNRISFSRGGPQAALPAAVQAAYDAANQQIQFNAATPNLAYDANGNLTSQTDASGTTFYTWDARNRLAGISGASLSASFAYDALGRRTSKTINGERTEYQYDGDDIVAEIVGGLVAATYLRSQTIDEPFIRRSGINEYYHTDALGSTMALTNQTGIVQTTYAYEAFGNATINGPSENRFQYTGRENDGTGLYYYRGRYYSPTLQRFISEDPIGFLGGINVYAYVGNNPLRYADPLGLDKNPPRPRPPLPWGPPLPPDTQPPFYLPPDCPLGSESCFGGPGRGGPPSPPPPPSPPRSNPERTWEGKRCDSPGGCMYQNRFYRQGEEMERNPLWHHEVDRRT